MSVKNTISLVRSFVQSDVCKALKHDDDDVSYLFSGRETPMRSCGCKAQRVLDRTRRFREKPEPDYCANIWFQSRFIQLSPEDRHCSYAVPYSLCHKCSLIGPEMWIEQRILPSIVRKEIPSFVDPSKLKIDIRFSFGEITKSHIGDFEDISSLPHDLSPMFRMDINTRRPGGVRWLKRLGWFLHGDWERLAWQHRKWACDVCCNGVSNIVKSDECGECYMSRPAVPVRRFQWESESEDEDDLMDLQWERPRVSTPEPSFQVFQENDNAVYVPFEALEDPPSPPVVDFDDLSDDDRLEYMLVHGYFY